MALDSTQLWVIVLGILSVLLAGIVFYSLRRLLMLRDAVVKSTELIGILEKQQEVTKNLLETDLIPKVETTTHTQGLTIERLLGDIRTISSQLSKVHDQVQDHENRIQNCTKRLKQVEVKVETLSLRERVTEAPSSALTEQSAGSPTKKHGATPLSPTGTASSSGPSFLAASSAGGGAATHVSKAYSEVMSSIQRRLAGGGDEGEFSVMSSVSRGDAKGSPLGLLTGGRSRGKGANSPRSSAGTTSFSLPTTVTVYHLTTNPNRIMKNSVYKKMRLGLQFSLGPDNDETALSLTPLTSSSSSPPGSPHRRDASSTVNSNSNPFASSSVSSATVLLYLRDILHVDLACDELPVDASDCVVFHITVARTARSTGLIDDVALSGRGIAASLSSGAAVDQPISTMRRSASGFKAVPSQLGRPSSSDVELEPMEGGLSANRKTTTQRTASERDPVMVTLFAPVSPSVEEWVQFLNENLGDRVSLGSSLL